MIFLLAIAHGAAIMLIALVVGALHTRVAELEQFQSDIISGADFMREYPGTWLEEEITVPDARAAVRR